MAVRQRLDDSNVLRTARYTTHGAVTDNFRRQCMVSATQSSAGRDRSRRTSAIGVYLQLCKRFRRPNRPYVIIPKTVSTRSCAKLYTVPRPGTKNNYVNESSIRSKFRFVQAIIRSSNYETRHQAIIFVRSLSESVKTSSRKTDRRK